MGNLCLSLFKYALLCVLSSFAIILKGKRELVALLLLSYRCLVAVNILWLFPLFPKAKYVTPKWGPFRSKRYNLNKPGRSTQDEATYQASRL